LLAAVRSHLRRWARLARAIKDHRPDVVHIHTCSYTTFYRTVLDSLACRLLRRCYVLHIHGGLFVEFLNSLRGPRRSIVFTTLRKAARVIVLSKAWHDRVADLVPDASLVVIPNVVQPDDQDGAPSERGGGVLFVGDLSEPKRPEDLLVAYSALPRALQARYRLTFLGSGEPDRQHWLIRVARQLGIWHLVDFAGDRPQEEVRGRMRQADLLVLPSRAEGMPLVLLEAMHAALPAVATRVGAIPEMVQDSVEAQLTEPMNTLALTRSMKTLLDDRALRRAMGEAARQRVLREFTLERFRTDMASLWAGLMEGGPARSVTPIPTLAHAGVGSTTARWMQQLTTGVRFW
jgi:glycosyltransferase involved in cell wall biosynthesis